MKQKQLLCISGDPVPPWALRGEAKKRSSVRPSTGGLALWIAPPTAPDPKLSQVWLLWTTSGIILSQVSAGDLVPDLVRIPQMERNHKKNVKPPIVPKMSLDTIIVLVLSCYIPVHLHLRVNIQLYIFSNIIYIVMYYIIQLYIYQLCVI